VIAGLKKCLASVKTPAPETGPAVDHTHCHSLQECEDVQTNVLFADPDSVGVRWEALQAVGGGQSYKNQKETGKQSN